MSIGKAATSSNLEFKIVLVNNGRRQDCNYELGHLSLKDIRSLAKSIIEDREAEVVDILINYGRGWEVLNTYSRS